LNQRSWRARPANGEWLIINHSVQHPDCPEKKGFVRAISILTGYYLKKIDGKSGTQLIYATQSDLRGKKQAYFFFYLLHVFQVANSIVIVQKQDGFQAWLPTTLQRTSLLPFWSVFVRPPRNTSSGRRSTTQTRSPGWCKKKQNKSDPSHIKHTIRIEADGQVTPFFFFLSS